MLEGWESSDLTVYLAAILGLLVVWQYYQMQIMAGRILAIDIFDRSGIRMYVYVTPSDDQICETCAASNGRFFLPSQVAKKKFSPLTGKCQRPTPCMGVLVGLYGAWLEARGVLEHLRKNSSKWRRPVVCGRSAGLGERTVGTVYQRRYRSSGDPYDRGPQL